MLFGDEEEWGLDRFLDKLSQVKFAQLTFVEQRKSIFLVDEFELTGSMLYRAPGYMEKNTLRPFPETVVIDDDLITIEKTRVGSKNDGAKEIQRYTIASHFLLHTAVESIRAILGGNIESLKENYLVEMSGEKSQWLLNLTPIPERIKAQVEAISLSGSGVEINKIEIINPDGDQTRLLLTYRELK